MAVIKTDMHLKEQTGKLEQKLQTMKENLNVERQTAKQARQFISEGKRAIRCKFR